MSIESAMPCSHLILCHPLLLCSVFLSIRVFSNEPALHSKWPKFWSSSFSISPSNEYSGLISFKTMVILGEILKVQKGWRTSRSKDFLINLIPFIFHKVPFSVWSFRKHSLNEEGWLTSVFYFTFIVFRLLFPYVSEMMAYNTDDWFSGTYFEAKLFSKLGIIILLNLYSISTHNHKLYFIPVTS